MLENKGIPPRYMINMMKNKNSINEYLYAS